ncbi:MAG: T9SS type A sorting domain-containing protein, partial [Crocinitomicaceae bacterium]
FHIPLPIVTGVSYYVHVDNAIPSTDSFKLIHNGITQILGLGDSMLIAPVATAPCIQFGEPCEVIKLSYNGPVPQLIPSYTSLKFMAVGTPTVAGENYPYSPCDAWFNQGIGCMFPHYVAVIEMGFGGPTGDTCFTTTNLVQSTTSIGEITETEAYIYPNPTNDVIYLNTDASFMDQSYILIDNLGRQVIFGKISASNTTIETTNLSKGIYLLSVGDSKKQNFKVIRE